MKITDAAATQRKIHAALLRTKPSRTSQDGKWVNPTVRIQDGTTGYVLSYHRDGKWRLGTTNVYGNVEWVRGEGCDASGLVITNLELMEALDS